MTEEEKNTNQKAEEKDEDEDKPDLTVKMPKANRVTMDPEVYPEEPDYLKVFANFYIAEFNQADLEIMNLYDKNHNIVDINDFLWNNIHFPRKILIKHVLKDHAKNFQNLLDEIQKEEDVDPKNMKTFDDWSKWYEKRRAEIPHSLS